MFSGWVVIGCVSFACGFLGLANLVNLPMFSSRSRIVINAVTEK